MTHVRRSGLVLLVHTLLAVGVARGQQTLPVDPVSYDLSGTWIVKSPYLRGVSGQWEVNRCDKRAAAESNYPLYGSSWMRLKVARTEPRMGAFGPELVLHYEGLFHFVQGYGASKPVNGPDGKPLFGVIEMDHFCHVETIDYALAGEQVGDRLHLTGTALGGSTLQHPRKIVVVNASEGGMFNPALARDILFATPEADIIWTGVGYGEMANVGQLPSQCPIFLTPPWDTFSLTQCKPLGGARYTFVRGEPSDELFAKGSIKGRLLEALPDGTPTTNALKKATVLLWKQPSAFRAKKAEESETEYKEFVARWRARRKLAARLAPDAEGRFEAKDLATMERLTAMGPNSYQRALYTVEVTGAEKEEIDPATNKPETILFETLETPNIRVGHDGPFHIRPFDALGIKLQVAVSLTERGPHQWGPLEEEVRIYLQQIVNKQLDLTPARNEGVKRGVWAERSALTGAELAEPLLALALEAASELITDIFGELMQNRHKGLKEAEELIEMHLKDRSFAMQNAKGFNFGGREWLMYERAIDTIKKENPLVQVSAIYDQVKNIFKYGFSIPAKNGLYRLGLTEDQATQVIDVVETWIFNLMDALIQGDVNGAFKAALGALVKDFLKSELYDSRVDVFPSFCALSRPELAFSKSAMMSWATDDRAAYQMDRDAAATIISTMSSRASDVLAKAQIARGVAEGAGAGADTLEIAKANPIVRVFFYVSKLAKFLGNGYAMVNPFLEAFGQMPDDIEKASYRAFGMVPPMSFMALPTAAPKVPYSNFTRMELSQASSDLTSVIRGLAPKLTPFTLPDAILLTTDTTTKGLLGASLAYTRALDRLLAHVGGAVGDDPNVDELVRAVATEALTVRGHLATAWAELSIVYARLLGNVYEGVNDQGLQLSLNRSKSQMAGLLVRIAELDRLAFGLDSILTEAMATVVPSVQVESVEARSEATGRDTVSRKPESFVVRAKVVNVSGSALAGVGARLVVRSPKTSVVVRGAAAQLLGATGALAANDGKPGGADEVEVTWTVDHAVNDPLEAVSLVVEVIENGTAPKTFRGTNGSVALLPDSTAGDQDRDGLLDAWETKNGTDPARADADADADGDGVPNIVERRRGTSPMKADTDGDGLSDGEELGAGQDGFITNPLVADTDGDGAGDAQDGSPIDGATTEKSAPLPEPAVGVSVEEVILTERAPIAVIDVTNAGMGKLKWAAAPETPLAITVSPGAPATGIEGDKLVISTKLPVTRRGIPGAFPVHIVDVSGAVRDEKVIRVYIGQKIDVDGGVTTGDAAAPMSADGGAWMQGDGGGAFPPDDEGDGCGCRVGASPRGPSLAACLLAAALVMALRRRRS